MTLILKQTSKIKMRSVAHGTMGIVPSTMIRCCTLFANQCYWLQYRGVDPRVPRFVEWTKVKNPAK
jgi:hypothetical protein